MKNKKNKNTLHRLFKFAGSCKGLLLSSVIFAVLGAGFEINPADGGNCSFGLSFAAWFFNRIYGEVSQSRIYCIEKYSYCTYEKIVTSAHGICHGYPVGKIQNYACGYG